jgi:hypothetical protein
MKTLLIDEAISKGERSGTILTPGGRLDVTLGDPLVPGLEKRGPILELLFAVGDFTVRALMSLIENDHGGYRLAVEYIRNSLALIASKLNASWTNRTKPAPIPKPCAATTPSS